MSSQIARIEIYPDYNADGSMNLELPFSYSCQELNLMGYTKLNSLVCDIRNKLKVNNLDNKNDG